MGTVKWIGGVLGWVAAGPIGALIGFLLGKAVDTYIDMARQLPGGDGTWSQGDTYSRGGTTYSRGTSRGGTTYTGGGSYSGRTGSTRTYTQEEQRNSFLVSLLVLSSAVIKADGKVHPSEVSTVEEFIRRNFGAQAATEARMILDKLNAQQVNIYQVGPQIAANMNYSQRLQLFHYLVSIATADGEFSRFEKAVLEAIASTIGLSEADAASVIAMYYREPEDNSAYAILEISPSATDDEVKAAYRKMAMKHHPDKVASLGPDVQKAAQEKFQKIQEAYETIKRQRGMN